MSASGKNMEAVVRAKEDHNKNCPWGGTAVRVCLHPFEIDRMGWEEGDVIAGLTVFADNSMSTGALRIECDAEPKSDSELTDEMVREKDRELTPA
jgi:hypothetical protein